MSKAKFVYSELGCNESPESIHQRPYIYDMVLPHTHQCIHVMGIFLWYLQDMLLIIFSTFKIKALKCKVHVFASVLKIIFKMLTSGLFKKKYK